MHNSNYNILFFPSTFLVIVLLEMLTNCTALGVLLLSQSNRLGNVGTELGNGRSSIQVRYSGSRVPWRACLHFFCLSVTWILPLNWFCTLAKPISKACWLHQLYYLYDTSGS